MSDTAGGGVKTSGVGGLGVIWCLDVLHSSTLGSVLCVSVRQLTNVC